MLTRFQHFVNIGLVFGTLVAPAYSQIIDLDDGTSVNVTAKFNKPMHFGPAQDSASVVANAGAGMAFYTAEYSSFGKSNPFSIIGTDPSLGAATTTIPVVIVPLKFVFPGTGSPTFDGTNIVTATVNSPVFQVADYTIGGTDLGITQYGDAIQRGEFWNMPGFSQGGYHVLLGVPSIAPTVTISVPSGAGNAYRLTNGGSLGVLDTTYFDSILAALLPQYTANELPIFATDNVYLGTGGVIQNCCILGFHDSQRPPLATAQTWIYAAYAEPGTFRGNGFVDVVPLSHETAEWLNDPFVGAPLLGGVNLVPPYVLPGQNGACQINFETGDALESGPTTFTVDINGTTYHVQDEAFLPWFLQIPSYSVNGFYSYLGTFKTPATLCGPG